MCYQRVRRILSDQCGVAMVVTLLALTLLLALAAATLQTSVSAFRTVGNDRVTKAAMVVAESGAEYARETLRQQVKGGATLNQLLTTAANNGTLVDATQLSSFNNSTGVTNNTSNRPVIASTTLGSGSFQVFLTNDRNETGLTQSASVQSTVDNNSEIMVTSFGNGPGGSRAVVQEQLKVFDAFLAGGHMPGLIILPGPSVQFSTSNSSASNVSGIDYTNNSNCYPTISVSTNAAKLYVDQVICGNNNIPYGSCGAFGGAFQCDRRNPAVDVLPTTENFLPTALNPYDPTNPNTAPLQVTDQHLIRVDYLTSLVQSIKAVADFHSLSDPGFNGGTATNPVIIAIDGDASFPNNWTGYGILLVTGQLVMRGGYTFHGLMLAVGAGSWTHTGSGGGYMWGTQLVANINTPWSVDPRFVGVPSYNENGGGNSILQYSSGDLSRYAAALMPLQRISFQLLR